MHRSLLLVSVSVAVAVTGWSSASAKSALSHAALVSGLNAACSKDHATVVAVRKQSAGVGQDDFEGTARLFARTLGALQKEQASIDRLTPSAKDRGAYRRFRGVIEREATYTRQTIAALRARDLNALGRLLATAKALHRQQIAAASAIGADQCKKV